LDRALRQMCLVNDWRPSEARKAASDAMSIWHKRNEIREWHYDFSEVKHQFGIDLQVGTQQASTINNKAVINVRVGLGIATSTNEYSSIERLAHHLFTGE